MSTSMEAEAELVDAVLVVAVNRSYPRMTAYDAARYAWPVSARRMAEVEYVLAAKDRRIVGVFKPTEWKAATRQNFPEFEEPMRNRSGFVGEEAGQEVKERYLGRLLPADFKFAGTGMRYAGKLAAPGPQA